ncbi:hypothetical protein LTR56_018135 [Elasticomyces elasticus]|nr:hypothetical protein LTR22_023143 [Elasticomyces elasticus]KAK3629248.1 hypothetical protein LTR56_018135 [Elasticomyces elasticus]KAK4912839.1 hypothetical protein LTR49_018801 [Elasticomyces elasticus]KAK5747307.1 hypothetical protein LTS12_022421 [Elasticomyces elasticus]
MDDAIILLTNSMKEDPYLSQTVTLQPDDNDVKVAIPRSTMISLSSDTSPLSFKCAAATNRLTIMPTRSNRARQDIIDYLKRKIGGFFAVEIHKLEGQLGDVESKKMCDLLSTVQYLGHGGGSLAEELDETNTAARIDVFRGVATGYGLCAAASGPIRLANGQPAPAKTQLSLSDFISLKEVIPTTDSIVLELDPQEMCKAMMVGKELHLLDLQHDENLRMQGMEYDTSDGSGSKQSSPGLAVDDLIASQYPQGEQDEGDRSFIRGVTVVDAGETTDEEDYW